MDNIFTRIERIKEASKNQPLIEQKLKHIESRYAHNVFSSEFTMTMDPEVIEELDEMEKTINSADSKYIAFLRNFLVKQVQSLSRLPVPQPPNFNRECFNSFVSTESRDLKYGIMEAEDKDYLLNMLKMLENQRLEFLCEPHKTIFQTHLSHFQGLLNNPPSPIGEEDKAILESLVLRIKYLDIQFDELEFYMDKYSLPIVHNDKLTYHVRDIEILQMIEDIVLFNKVAKIMGISQNDSDIIFEVMMLEKQKTKITAMLTKKLIIHDYKCKDIA
jgi:hypothetical protein